MWCWTRKRGWSDQVPRSWQGGEWGGSPVGCLLGAGRLEFVLPFLVVVVELVEILNGGGEVV